MQAIVSRTYGPPDQVLQVEDVDTPVAGDHDVVVRTRATSVNPADWHLVRGEPRIARPQLGLRAPKHHVLGCDVSGEVHAVGAAVTTFRPGDEVFGSPFMRGFGAFAEYVRVPVDCLSAKPAGLGHEQAAAVPLAALTALQGLRDHGRLTAGQRVLIIGASGGVGTFAVQIARSLGAEVTGVCSARNVDLVRSLGADHVVDYTSEDVTRSAARYDLVLQVAGAHAASALRRVLTPRGVLVMISGDAEGRWVGPVGRMVAARLTSPFVGQTLTGFTVTVNADDLEAVGRQIEAGGVTPVIDRTYAFGEVAEALLHLETGRARGKVVIAPVP
ncbi:MAG TPA: NAD(P)-dependent alcohol dehydrogenase [Acidimicrobiales bacterium]|nr:NAD(P)-dependent alcohol dehydrogenase [Acidimicrobiales bacterium]